MFQKTKNIDTAFQQVRLFCLVLVLGCIIFSVFVVYKSYKMVTEAESRVYMLANGKVLQAFSSDRKDNILVEAKDDVKTFHEDFFTLDPDEKVIRTNITKALYLADASAKRVYDNLKESNYYIQLISGNVSQEIDMDSIAIDINQYPYYFKYYGTQRIIRSTSITTRRIKTEGYLRSVSRSDNNSHGFIIEKWAILDNTDIKTEIR